MLCFSMNPPFAPTRLALFLQVNHHWGRAIAQGVFRAARAVAGWQPFLVQSKAELEFACKGPDKGPEWVGIIGQFYPEHAGLLRKLHAYGVPSVNVSGCRPPDTTLWIHNDDQGCGEMAARFFIDRGYRNFAYMGVPGIEFSDSRFEGFKRYLVQQGLPPPADLTHAEDKTNSAMPFTTAKIAELAKPCALFVCNDQRANQCLSAAESVGVKVPEALSIIGVDDDDLFCEMSSIALSSVRPDWRRIGEGAVEMLLTAGQEAQQSSDVRVPPVEIVVRRSSDATAIEDELSAAVVQFVHDNIDGELDCDSLALAMGVSRRTLERHLLKTIGQTSRATIMNARMQRAYQRVVSTRLTFGEIASLCGFSKQSHFNSAFKKLFGLTPTQARKG